MKSVLIKFALLIFIFSGCLSAQSKRDNEFIQRLQNSFYSNREFISLIKDIPKPELNKVLNTLFNQYKNDYMQPYNAKEMADLLPDRIKTGTCYEDQYADMMLKLYAYFHFQTAYKFYSFKDMNEFEIHGEKEIIKGILSEPDKYWSSLDNSIVMTIPLTSDMLDKYDFEKNEYRLKLKEFNLSNYMNDISLDNFPDLPEGYSYRGVYTNLVPNNMPGEIKVKFSSAFLAEAFSTHKWLFRVNLEVNRNFNSKYRAIDRPTGILNAYRSQLGDEANNISHEKLAKKYMGLLKSRKKWYDFIKLIEKVVIYNIDCTVKSIELIPEDILKNELRPEQALSYYWKPNYWFNTVNETVLKANEDKNRLFEKLRFNKLLTESTGIFLEDFPFFLYRPKYKYNEDGSRYDADAFKSEKSRAAEDAEKMIGELKACRWDDDTLSYFTSRMLKGWETVLEGTTAEDITYINDNPKHLEKYFTYWIKAYQEGVEKVMSDFALYFSKLHPEHVDSLMEASRPEVNRGLKEIFLYYNEIVPKIRAVIDYSVEGIRDIHKGDIIISIDGQGFEDVKGFYGVLSTKKPGSIVEVAIYSEYQKEKFITVKLTVI